MRALAALAILLAAAAQAQAQDALTPAAWPPVFSGSYKGLATTSRSFAGQQHYADVLNRLRLAAHGAWGNRFSYDAEVDHQVHLGNLIGLPDFDAIRNRNVGAAVDLLHVYADRKHLHADVSLYRGTLSWRSDTVSVTAGRQRIAWGVAHFWSPADFFNPITPLIVDRDFRQGVDAAQMEWTGNGGWRWTGLYAPAAKQGPHARYGLRIETPSTGRDVGIFAVRSGDDWTGGASFAGQFKGAGIRGEGTFRWSAAPLQPNAFRFAAGADYAFRGNLYLDTEYFYNQGQPPGSAGPSGTALPSSTTEIVTGRRHFLSAGL
jgi:opacity protein-like surface antigen